MAAADVTVRRTDPGLRMSTTERKLAYAMAAAAVPVFFFVVQPSRSGTHAIAFVLAAAFPAAMAVAARAGHRIWTAVASFAVLFDPAWSYYFIFGAFYVAFAFWLAWRAHRATKASVETVGGHATPMPSGRATPKKRA